MKTKLVQGLLAAVAFGAVSLGAAGEAAAITPVPQGTFKVAAERMAGVSLTFGGGGDPLFGTGLLWGNPAPLQFPRVGLDYFVIDGLSIGGSAGIQVLAGNGGSVFVGGILPRVGYAFALSPSIDFWPRGGIGFIGQDGGGGFGGGGTYGVLFLEAPFIWNITPDVGLAFGPALDVNLDAGQTTLGGNAGIVVTF